MQNERKTVDEIRQPLALRNKLLNPFVFPAETDGRFLMLSIGVVMLVFYVMWILSAVLPVFGFNMFIGHVDLMGDFSKKALDLAGKITLDDLRNREYMKNVRIEMSMLRLNILVQSLPSLAFFLLGSLTPVLIANRMLLFNIRRNIRGMKSLLDDDMRLGKIRQKIYDIAGVAGIVSIPDIFVSRGEFNDAQVFGVAPRYAIRLTARDVKGIDMIAELERRICGNGFNVIILHEMGHIVNNDVNKSQIADNLLKVCTLLIFVPSVVIVVISGLLTDLQAQGWGNTQQSLIIAGKFLFFIIAVYMIKRGLLRTREFYADWRVLLWGEGCKLIEMLKEKETQMIGQNVYMMNLLPASICKVLERCVSVWKRWWGFHTLPQERCDYLCDYRMLFKISSDTSFFTGFLLSMTIYIFPIVLTELNMIWGVESDLTRLAIFMMTYKQSFSVYLFGDIVSLILTFVPYYRLFFVASIVSYMIIRSIGCQIQRNLIVNMIEGKSVLDTCYSFLKVALLMSLGMECGIFLISFMDITNLSVLISEIVWFVVFVAMTWFWLMYSYILNRIVIGDCVGLKRSKYRDYVVIIGSLLSIGLLYMPMALIRVIILTIPLMQDANIVPDYLKGGMPSGSENYMIMMVPFVLLILGMSLFLVWSVISLGSIWFWRKRRHINCPHCKHILRDPQAVGRVCPACYQPLAAWLYVNKRDEV